MLTPRRDSDSIKIHDLLLTVFLQDGAQWMRDAAVEQPISVSVCISHDVSPAARTDDLSLSLDYYVIANFLRNSIQNETFHGLRDVSRHISSALADVLADFLDGLEVHVGVVQLRSPVHTRALRFDYLATFRPDGSCIPKHIMHHVLDLSCPLIIGVDPQERVYKQDVVVDLTIQSEGNGFDGEAIDLRLITETLYDVSKLLPTAPHQSTIIVFYYPENYDLQLPNS